MKIPGEGHGVAHVFATGGFVPPDVLPLDEPVDPPLPVEPLDDDFEVSPGAVSVAGSSPFAGAPTGSDGGVVTVATVVSLHATAIMPLSATAAHADEEKPFAIGVFLACVPGARNHGSAGEG